MENTKIAVVGCGNIGSRSLQALAKLDGGACLYAVDPSSESLARSRRRIDELGPAALAQTVFLDDVRKLPNSIDLAVIATCADVRRSAVESLFECSHIRSLVLEKFLFQRLDDYAAVETMLTKTGTRCWVNLLRRIWPGYQMLRRQFSGNGPVEMQAIGHDYRLASNAIHYLDLYGYVTGARVVSLDGSDLSPQDGPVRRQGFRELCGILRGRSSDNAHMTLGSYRGSNVPVVVQFVSPHAHCIVKELDYKAWFVSADTGWTWREIEFPAIDMSNMTATYADILRTGECVLPEYKEAAADHLALIEVFNRHWFGAEWKDNPCPVT